MCGMLASSKNPLAEWIMHVCMCACVHVCAVVLEGHGAGGTCPLRFFGEGAQGGTML